MTDATTDARAALEAWRPRRRPGVEVLASGDHGVVWGDRVAVPSLLPAVETVLFDALDGETTVGDLVVDLVDVFGATPDRAGTDLERLLADWWHLGLVEAPPEVLVELWQLAIHPPEGPDPSDHPLQTPAVLPPPGVAELVAWHRPGKLVVQAGELRFAVTVEEPDLFDRLQERLRPLVREGDARWRYAVLRERGPQETERPLLLLSDIGLPLLRTSDDDAVVAAVTRRISHVIDLATPGACAWFRLHAAVRDGGVVLLQHEFLHAWPALDEGLRSRGFSLVQTDHTAIDVASGDVVVAADRFAGAPTAVEGPITVDARCALLGTVVAGGPDVGPTPTTPDEWRWLFCLYSVIGHEPRADSWRDRWQATAHLTGARCELVAAFDAETVLAAVDRITGDAS
jgi:hypothetical protein